MAIPSGGQSGAVQLLHSPPSWRKDSASVVGLSNLYGGAVQPLLSPPCRKDSPTFQGLNFHRNCIFLVRNNHSILLKTNFWYSQGFSGYFKATFFFNRSIPLIGFMFSLYISTDITIYLQSKSLAQQQQPKFSLSPTSSWPTLTPQIGTSLFHQGNQGLGLFPQFVNLAKQCFLAPPPPSLVSCVRCHYARARRHCPVLCPVSCGKKANSWESLCACASTVFCLCQHSTVPVPAQYSVCISQQCAYASTLLCLSQPSILTVPDPTQYSVCVSQQCAMHSAMHTVNMPHAICPDYSAIQSVSKNTTCDV